MRGSYQIEIELSIWIKMDSNSFTVHQQLFQNLTLAFCTNEKENRKGRI